LFGGSKETGRDFGFGPDDQSFIFGNDLEKFICIKALSLIYFERRTQESQSIWREFFWHEDFGRGLFGRRHDRGR
jgi:hypothetical protein